MGSILLSRSGAVTDPGAYHGLARMCRRLNRFSPPTGTIERLDYAAVGKSLKPPQCPHLLEALMKRDGAKHASAQVVEALPRHCGLSQERTASRVSPMVGGVTVPGAVPGREQHEPGNGRLAVI